MQLTRISFGDQQPTATEYAVCVRGAEAVCTLGDNRNSPQAWYDLPVVWMPGPELQP